MQPIGERCKTANRSCAQHTFDLVHVQNQAFSKFFPNMQEALSAKEFLMNKEPTMLKVSCYPHSNMPSELKE